MDIAVVGAGYVGFTTAVCFAKKGHRVTCVDRKNDIVVRISKGTAPFHETGSEQLLKEALCKKLLSATTDLHRALESAEAVFIAVPTPYNGSSIDLSDIRKASSDIGVALRNTGRYIAIAVKSTVVPLSTESVIRPVLEECSGKKCGRGFGLSFNPEFLREGSAVDDFMNPDRIVIGACDAKSVSTLKRLYSGFNAPIIATTPRTAELIKYAANALFATLISFSNELADIAEGAGDIDIKEVMEAVSMDRRLNPRLSGRFLNPGFLKYLEAGCGFGGSCFPKDIKSLASFAKTLGISTPLTEAVISINERRAERVVGRLKGVYPDLKGLKVALLGLSFKPFTDDVRDSPAIAVARRLAGEGADVCVYDPLVEEEFDRAAGLLFTHAGSWQDAVADAHAAFLVTSWPEFASITQDKLSSLMASPLLIDCRRMLERKNFENYIGVGHRPLSTKPRYGGKNGR
jgi:UDPglucose 6-dehydrogenase/GDP-mannose 6-dehydrogenase